jgi:hypothetical protein
MVNIDRVLKQQNEQMQKILIRSRKQTIESLINLADTLDDIHTDANRTKANWTAVSMASNTATLAGLALAPTTFGTSLALTTIGSVGGYVSNTLKDEDSVQADVQIKTLLDLAQTMVDSEIKTIEAEKLRLNSLIADAKAVGIGAYKTYTLSKQAIAIGEAIRTGEMANASQIVLNSSRLLNTLTAGFTIVCIAHDALTLIKTENALDNNEKSKYAQQLRDIAAKLQNNICEMENELKKQNDNEDDRLPYD